MAKANQVAQIGVVEITVWLGRVHKLRIRADGDSSLHPSQDPMKYRSSDANLTTSALVKLVGELAEKIETAYPNANTQSIGLTIDNQNQIQPSS
jgi:hypothetical protein